MFSAGRVGGLPRAPTGDVTAPTALGTVTLCDATGQNGRHCAGEERKKKTLCYIRNMINVWDEYPLHQINIPLLSRVHTTTF